VPAAAAIQRVRALFVLIGCKGYVGGLGYIKNERAGYPFAKCVFYRFSLPTSVKNEFG
jgi:hypothetical protein